jgi:hypothetical protein
VPDIDLRINSTRVSELSIQSVIISATAGTVSAPPLLNVMVAQNADVTEFAPADNDMMSIDPPEIQIATPGDVVTLASPHLLQLQQGPHVQQITLSVPLPGRPKPLQYTTYRFFDVQADGLHSLTPSDYSRLVSPMELIPRPDGTVIMARIGHLGPPTPQDTPSATPAGALVESGNRNGVAQ